jgi:hypothetical protein
MSGLKDKPASYYMTISLVLTSLLLQGATSPAAVAAQSTSLCDDVTEIPSAECEALVALYDATSGPGWVHNDGWLQTNTPCTWCGVECDSGHVTGLWLSENLLTGPIPPDLGNLRDLHVLSLYSNRLSGMIPPELGYLAGVVHLSIAWNQLTGSIPPEVGNLSNLRGLDLSHNQLNGSIPPELANLVSAQALWLTDNQLAGAIPPELGPNLEGLWLEHNLLTGTIPPELGSASSLRDLRLSYNSLSGGIPPELGNLSHLYGLYLDHNHLTGGIPPELGNLGSMGQLILDHNHLEGEIPPELGQLPSILSLILSANRLSGSIPEGLGRAGQLCQLWVDNNQLSGVIPRVRFSCPYGTLPSYAGYNTLTGDLGGWDLDWAETQTMPPSELGIATVAADSVVLAWTPILYTRDGGYYEVSYSTTPGGPYTIHGTTNDKSAAGYTVDGLSPDTTYYFVVRAFTPAHGDQQNNLWSAYGNEITASTAPAPAGPPSIESLSPAGIQSEGDSFSLTVNGSGFVASSTAQWNGTDLATILVSPAQLTATILAQNIAAAGVAYITVRTTPGGETSNPEAFFITETGAEVTGSDTTASSDPGGTVVASTGAAGVTATAEGAGIVAVAQFASRPGTTTPGFDSTDEYFDVHLSQDSSFNSVTIVDCDLNGANFAYWWDGTTWILASDQSYDEGTGCITVTVNESTLPSLENLEGTYFGAGIDHDPPVADGGGPYTIDEGGTVTLDASASSDPDGYPLTYEWDLDGDGSYDDAAGISAQLTFPNEGLYTVGLRVTDPGSLSATDTVQITVINVSPVVDILQATVNNLRVLAGTGSFVDPGADIWTATVRYGDGTGARVLSLNPDKSFSLSHTYARNGTFTVQVCVRDDDGGLGCDQTQVRVSINRPPVANAGGPYSTTEGSSITLDASRSTDPDNNIVRYEWDLDNDGQFDDATGVRPAFMAPDNGVFTVGVRVTDAGGLSSVATAAVTVRNSPPTITSFTINSPVRVGTVVNARAVFRDAGIYDTFTATWNWGDGSTTGGSISNYVVTGSHTYNRRGIFLVTITITDKDGGVGRASRAVTVSR